MATVHIIGAGMSGLACAVRCTLAGRRVALYEAAPQAGGRSRSFHDEGLGCMIDNGNHMLLGSNTATRSYLSDLGSADLITEIRPASFPFHDLETGQRWVLRPAGGVFARWLLFPDRRVPGSRIGDYLEVLRLARASPRDTVADCVDVDKVLYQRLWQPFTRAVLNTDASEASARLLWDVIAGTFLKGEAACRPLLFSNGLTPTLVEPALKLIGARKSDIRFQARARGLRYQDGRVIAIYFPEGLLGLDTGDAVVLAVPPEICTELWPPTRTPKEFRPIINVHFRLPEPAQLAGGIPFLGLIGATGQWLFTRGNILSVTISAGTALVDTPNWEIANRLWAEVSRALNRNMGRLPPWRVIKERRATLAQTPAQILRRPPPTTDLANLFIAGDWTATGLPCTIEGSIQSGFTAARLALEATTQGAEAS